MKKRLFAILGVLLIIFCVILYFAKNDIKKIFHEKINSNYIRIPFVSPAPTDHVDLHFLDIGQGDATLIIFPNGEKMLVDCSLDSRILEALGRVMSYQDHTIDYLLATHPDQDHYGGCVDVLERYEVKHIFFTGMKKERSQYLPVFLESIQREKTADYTEVNRESTITISSTTLHILYPDDTIEKLEPLKKLPVEKASNNTSIVFLLQYGTQKALFTGDAEFETESYLVKKYGVTLDSDILKVGHHGSKNSSSDMFLQYVTPDIATISSGKGNSYGHPTTRALRRLQRVHANIWRTDEKGDILIQMYPDHVYVQNK